MIQKIVGWAGVIAAFAGLIGYGIVYGSDRTGTQKDIESLKKTDEKIVSDTDQLNKGFNEFILKQSVYNESVAGSLNGINKILDNMNKMSPQ